MMEVTAPENTVSARKSRKTALKSDREAAFEELYETVFPQVARYLRRRGGTLEDAKDIFHEAMILFYEKTISGKLPERAAPDAYLFGTARNLWRRRFRKKDPTCALREIDAIDDIADDDRPGFSHRLFEYLERAGRKCMDLLQAFYYHRFSMEEIAAEFGFSSRRSATVQKYKCLEKVREEARREQP